MLRVMFQSIPQDQQSIVHVLATHSLFIVINPSSLPEIEFCEACVCVPIVWCCLACLYIRVFCLLYSACCLMQSVRNSHVSVCPICMVIHSCTCVRPNLFVQTHSARTRTRARARRHTGDDQWIFGGRECGKVTDTWRVETALSLDASIWIDRHSHARAPHTHTHKHIHILKAAGREAEQDAREASLCQRNSCLRVIIVDPNGLLKEVSSFLEVPARLRKAKR